MKEKKEVEKKKTKLSEKKSIDRWGNSIVALRAGWMKVKVKNNICKKTTNERKKEVGEKRKKVKVRKKY